MNIRLIFRLAVLFVLLFTLTITVSAIGSHIGLDPGPVAPIIDVSGKVTDQQGQALPGVNVLVKGTSKGTSTDFDGAFELSDVEENAIIIFSYIGYQTLVVALEGRTALAIQMSSDAQLLDELFVVGYGTVKKSDLA